MSNFYYSILKQDSSHDLDQSSFSVSSGDAFSFSMFKIPSGLRISLNLDFIFILENHHPLRIKDASSGVNS